MTDKPDIEHLSPEQLLSLPESAIPPEDLPLYLALKAVALQQKDQEHEQGRKHSPQQQEQERREAAGREREKARFLERIAEEERRIAQRRQEIDDNAIRLKDGRRAYVDGKTYRDAQGRELTGTDWDDAAEQHCAKPDASTWQEKVEIERENAELKRIKQQAAAHPENLTGYEKEFEEKFQQSKDGAPDYGDGDYASLKTVFKTNTSKIVSHETIDKSAEPAVNRGAPQTLNTKLTV